MVGPTATGKSALGIALAKALRGEVVNADSMQLYRGMDIGTAKLTDAEQQGVPHHLLDIWPVVRTASVADYQRLARDRIAALLARGVTPVVVGGSGLYVRAVLDRMEFPGTDATLRAELEQELATVGPAPLHARLAAADPAAAQAILPTNGRRIVRALEVISLTGRSRRRCRRTSRCTTPCRSGWTFPTTSSTGGWRSGSTGCSPQGSSTRCAGSSARGCGTG